jgi:P4 family phage/plasmid primase-like protien
MGKDMADMKGQPISNVLEEAEALGATMIKPPVPIETGTREKTFEPGDYSDVGEMRILSREYKGIMRHSTATRFIVFNGKRWTESEPQARGLMHELTETQKDEAEVRVKEAEAALESANNQPMRTYTTATDTPERSEARTELEKAQKELEIAKSYKAFVKKCRSSGTITGVLKEAQTPLDISVSELDAHPFLLNTPNGEIDLRTGALLKHEATHFHTKMTGAVRSNTGAVIWGDMLNLVTCKDVELQDYLQLIAGQMAVGRVFNENLIIAYGSGANGKSTLFNTLARVMGDYASGISAEILTTGRKTSKCWEIAELRGQRLILAPELEEGTRLDAAFVKKICSTDRITAEKKYKDPFQFEPSHTTVLYTNHLPKVGSDDTGTWRRLVVVPFNAKIEITNSKMDYAIKLYREAGGAVLAWIIEGAKRYIKADYHIDPPQCVKQAIADYKAANDWLSDFLFECCDVGKSFNLSGSDLYNAYVEYCNQTSDYKRNNKDFKIALENRGFESHRVGNTVKYYGLKLNEEHVKTPMNTWPNRRGYE